jgi:putative ABC transport system substrate-binding protein
MLAAISSFEGKEPMRRRQFITALAGAAAWPCAARAQQPTKLHRAGVLAAGAPPTTDPLWMAFKQGFRDVGYTEGQNLLLEPRFASGDLDRLPALLAELVAMKVEVIVVLGPAPMRVAKAGAQNIPIVMVAGSSDPIGEGFIQSFARPGATITGLTYAVSSDRFGKQLEVLKEAVGRVSRLGVLWDADADLFRASWAPALHDAARRLGLEIDGPFLVRKPDELESAFAEMVKRQVEAVLVTSSAFIYQNRQRVAEIAGRHRLPSIAAIRDFPATGSLMSYGPNFAEIYRRAAVFVDKILKGTPPGEIPVEQPSKHELVINLTTAKALGLVIPPALLARADEIIE